MTRGVLARKVSDALVQVSGEKAIVRTRSSFTRPHPNREEGMGPYRSQAQCAVSGDDPF